MLPGRQRAVVGSLERLHHHVRHAHGSREMHVRQHEHQECWGEHEARHHSNSTLDLPPTPLLHAPRSLLCVCRASTWANVAQEPCGGHAEGGRQLCRADENPCSIPRSLPRQHKHNPRGVSHCGGETANVASIPGPGYACASASCYIPRSCARENGSR